MAAKKCFSVEDAVAYCLESDEDSSTGGMSSGEEEELDKELLQNNYDTPYAFTR